MRRLTACSIALFFCATFAFPAPPDAKKYGWYTDYVAAKAEAKCTGKPMLVVFRCER